MAATGSASAPPPADPWRLHARPQPRRRRREQRDGRRRLYRSADAPPVGATGGRRPPVAGAPTAPWRRATDDVRGPTRRGGKKRKKQRTPRPSTHTCTPAASGGRSQKKKNGARTAAPLPSPTARVDQRPRGCARRGWRRGAAGERRPCRVDAHGTGGGCSSADAQHRAPDRSIARTTAPPRSRLRYIVCTVPSVLAHPLRGWRRVVRAPPPQASHTHARDGAVLVEVWDRSSKSGSFGLPELVGTPHNTLWLYFQCKWFETRIFSNRTCKIHQKRLAAVQTVRAREHMFMLQNCASECFNNRTYRTLQEACDEPAPCALGSGSEALICRLRVQALSTHQP